MLILDRQVGENSIVDNFGAFNWRPDSETVASRAFARASVIFEFRGGYFFNTIGYLLKWRSIQKFLVAFPTLAVFGPEGADSLG